MRGHRTFTEGLPKGHRRKKAGYSFIDNGIIEKNLYFYHPDHLGSSSYITDREGRITQHTEYIAFGEVLFEEHSISRTMPYLFNGKELDSEMGLYYYGARYYDPKTNIFLNVDPLAEKYPHISLYTYILNNPIKFIDLDGRAPEDVIIVFNKSTGKLVTIDLDHFKKGLPTKVVSAENYVLGGIRDANGKLTHNQVLVIKNVFSGGKSTNGVVERDLGSDQLPIPNGRYDLLEYEKRNGSTKYSRKIQQRGY